MASERPAFVAWAEDATLRCVCGHDTHGVTDYHDGYLGLDEDSDSLHCTPTVTCEECGATYKIGFTVTPQ